MKLELFKAALAAYYRVIAPPRRENSLNQDLQNTPSYPPADAEQIADHCGVIGLVRDTRGAVPQPTWYSSLSVIGTCVDGERIAQDWSSGHADYTPNSPYVARKLAQALAYPPTTCTKLHDEQPEICEACVHWGKIKSPISLGFEQAVALAPATPVIPSLPPGFALVTQNGRHALTQSTPRSEGAGKEKKTVWDDIEFCSTLYYPIKRIHSADGAMLEIEMHMPDNTLRHFVLECSTVGEGGRALSSELASHGIVAHPGLKLKQEAYMTNWMDKLKYEALEVMSYRRFGWYDEKFLVGTTLITPKGNEQVLCHGNASRKSGAFDQIGSYDTWKHVIDTAYNRPGQEALQYLVILGFAAPLFSMFQELGGVTVYSHSEGSGVGKTTAQRAALSVWGDWQQLQLADGKTTENALWGLVGTYCNLPVVFDELTNQSNEMASKIVFSVSSGRQRERMGADGELKENNSNWSTILMASGNNLLTEKLSVNRNNAEAEISRTFEFTVPHNSRMSPNEARELFPSLLTNYGHAGLEYMEWVVAHREEVKKLLFAVQKQFNHIAGITQTERYWSSLQASVITALHICRKLNILGFSKRAMLEWIEKQISLSRSQRNESISDPLETMGRLLAELWQGILVTRGEGDIRRNLIAEIIQHPRNQLVGRAIIAIDKSERSVLLLSCAAVTAWCNDKGASGKELFTAVVAKGWAEPEFQRVSLGKGVLQYVTTNTICWVIDLQKMSAESRDHMVAQRLQLVSTPGVANVQHTIAPIPTSVAGSRE